MLFVGTKGLRRKLRTEYGATFTFICLRYSFTDLTQKHIIIGKSKENVCPPTGLEGPDRE
jgi:hypothetical protein